MIVALASLTEQEWEALCDGCGRCCLCKFEDEECGVMLYTDIGCRLLDADRCRRRHYDARREMVAECLDIRQLTDDQFRWLPESCAYRLAHEGRPLPAWHPWRSGSRDSVEEAGISIRGKVAASSEGMAEEQLIRHIIT